MPRYTDISGEIGPLFTHSPSAPMYSYNTPAVYFWNGIADGLRQRGWKKRQVIEFLQSKGARWLFDLNELPETLENLGKVVAAQIHAEYPNKAFDR